MSVRPSVTTGLLLVATVISAAGLNLAVMALDRQSPVDEAAEQASQSFGADAELISSDRASGSTPALLPIGAETDASRSSGPASESTSAAAVPDAAGTGETIASDQSVDSDSQAGPGSESTSGDDDKGPAPSPSPVPTTTTRSPAPGPPPDPVGPTTRYETYDFDGVASIVIAVHPGNVLEFWSASPVEGWAYKVEDNGPKEVSIKFRPTAGGEEAEFEIEVEDGRLEVKREH